MLSQVQSDVFPPRIKPTTWTSSFRVHDLPAALPSEHPVQVLLCVGLLRGAFLGAVLFVVVLQDGHHVVVAEVDGLVHRRVAPPVGKGTGSLVVFLLNLTLHNLG